MLSDDHRYPPKRLPSKVNVLSEDLQSLSRNSKDNLDVLGQLETRVQKLRSTNMHGSPKRPWADRQVQANCMALPTTSRPRYPS